MINKISGKSINNNIDKIKLNNGKLIDDKISIIFNEFNSLLIIVSKHIKNNTLTYKFDK